MKNELLDYPWDILAELQAREESITRIGPWADAHRDKLDYLVNLIASGNVPDRKTLNRRLRNVEINHQQTFRRRRELDAATLVVVPARFPDTIVDAIIIRESVRQARGLVAPIEWNILSARAKDMSYAELASWTGQSVGAVKTRVSRCRASIRRQLPRV